MLDINFVRQNKDQVKEACVNKNLDSSIIDQLLAVDEKRRSLQQKMDELRSQANTVADEIKTMMSSNVRDDKAVTEKISKGKILKVALKQLEPKDKEINEKFVELMSSVPNVPASDVPIGKDESFNQVVKREGQKRNFDFTPKTHEEVMQNLDWLDTDRAAKIAGFRGYFLKNEALFLEQALMLYALSIMKKHGFTVMSAPILVNKEAMFGTGYFPWGAQDHYYTQDGQILAGTAEVALTAYRGGELLREKDLPIKICGISPCFRREVGSYGKDTKGIIRVHQFNKVEQVVLTVADEEVTRDWHTKMLGFSEELLRGLGLPYQVLLMCSGDMGAGQRKKYDIETWFPGQGKYRETHSASYFNDFQARRLNIRYQAKDGSTKFVYTLNNTVAASPRLLAAVIENYQQADGSVEIPEVLRPFMI